MSERKRAPNDPAQSSELEEENSAGAGDADSPDVPESPGDQTDVDDVAAEAESTEQVEVRDQPAERDVLPREGESPAQPPREDPPAAEDAQITDKEPWWQVPNTDGFGGVPWEELRKGMARSTRLSPEQRLWDDRGVSKPQQIDYPKKTWEELPEQTEPSGDEKISTS